MQWTEEARVAISRVPFFVRKRVKRRVEEEALRQGANIVTLDHVRACQKRFLEKMEEEVKGFRVESCFGPTGCPNRAIETNNLIPRLEELLEKKNLKEFLQQRVGSNLKLHHEFTVSISDCPNACSRPQIADIGLIGCRRPKVGTKPCDGCGVCILQCEEEAIVLEEDGPTILADKCLGCGKCLKVCPTGTLEQSEKGYRLLVGGKLGRHPRLATEIPAVRKDEEVLRSVERITLFYLKNSWKGERLGEILKRVGEEKLLEELSL